MKNSGWGLFSERMRDELQAAHECVCVCVKRINIENSDKEAIISIQSIFYPLGLLGGWR